MVAVIVVLFIIHFVAIQPDHALVNKNYVMTINEKITTKDVFDDDRTESHTSSTNIHLNSHKKLAYSADNVEQLKQNVRYNRGGNAYDLSNNNLKLYWNGHSDSMTINNIHRSGNKYVGTMDMQQDGDDINGTVTFQKE